MGSFLGNDQVMDKVIVSAYEKISHILFGIDSI